MTDTVSWVKAGNGSCSDLLYAANPMNQANGNRENWMAEHGKNNVKHNNGIEDELDRVSV